MAEGIEMLAGSTKRAAGCAAGALPVPSAWNRSVRLGGRGAAVDGTGAAGELCCAPATVLAGPAGVEAGAGLLCAALLPCVGGGRRCCARPPAQQDATGAGEHTLTWMHNRAFTLYCAGNLRLYLAQLRSSSRVWNLQM